MPSQSGRIKAVHAQSFALRVIAWIVTGQRAQISRPRDPFLAMPDFPRIDRDARERKVATEDSVDLRFALLGFERASAVDDDAAGLDERDCLLEQTRLQLR